MNRILTSFEGYLRLLESTTPSGQEIVVFEPKDHKQFVQHLDLLRKQGKGHQWDIDKKDVWDIYMKPGTIIIIAPYKDSNFAGIMLKDDGSVWKAYDNYDRPIPTEIVEQILSNSNIRKAVAKMRLSRIRMEDEGYSDDEVV